MLEIDMFEETRVLSIMSSRFYILKYGDQQYGCINGVIMPFSLAQSITLWVMTGAKYYKSSIDYNQVEKIQKLNPKNEWLQSTTRTTKDVSEYLYKTAKAAMSTWNSENFSDLLLN